MIKVDLDIGYQDGREFGRGDLGGQKRDDFEEDGTKKPVPVEEDQEGGGDGGDAGEPVDDAGWDTGAGDEAAAPAGGDGAWDTGAGEMKTEDAAGSGW